MSFRCRHMAQRVISSLMSRASSHSFASNSAPTVLHIPVRCRGQTPLFRKLYSVQQRHQRHSAMCSGLASHLKPVCIVNSQHSVQSQGWCNRQRQTPSRFGRTAVSAAASREAHLKGTLETEQHASMFRDKLRIECVTRPLFSRRSQVLEVLFQDI